MQREFQSLGHRIEDPAQDGLSGSPGSVPFEELFEGSRLLAMGAVLVVQASENSVQSVKKSAFYSKPSAWIALHHTQEIIYVYIPLL
jgi:hypothetical protein